MSLYRKKPVIIEAWQWTGAKGNINMAPQWLKDAYCKEWPENGAIRYYEEELTGLNLLQVMTLEGVHNAVPCDFIIQGVKGEIYPCKPDIFEMTYERIDHD